MKSHIGSKIKEYRTKLGLTQEELARKAEVTYVTLTKVESGVIRNPSLPFITKVAKALGIHTEELHEFLPEFNLEQSTKILKGEQSIAQLLDDVFKTLKNSGGEVYISGVDERKFLDSDRKSIQEHIKRLADHNITERLLARENDSFFFAGPQSIYRWVPENLFNPSPIYVYRDKIAMIVWGDHGEGGYARPLHQVIIIRNLALADAYRKQFLFIWNHAQIPPTQTQPTEDERKRLERTLLKRFGNRLSPITDHDKKIFRGIIQKSNQNSYGNSFYYLCQAANGIGEQKLGLKYFDGSMLATIGIFDRTSLGGGLHYHIIHPMGQFDTQKILKLSKNLLELSGNPVFVKKISKSEQSELFQAGFSPIEDYPWHAQAMEEDDTYPEQTIDIQTTLNQIETKGNGDLKDKYQRFMTRFGSRVRTEELSTANTEIAVKIVNEFFGYLEEKGLHISFPSDYDNIIFHPPLGKNGKAYFSQIIHINGTPTGFFAIEPISSDTAGLYANITLHQEFPYLSEYLVVYCCKLLKSAGYKFLNLGGSETAGLFQFKEKFSPVQYNKMHWVVYKI